MPKKKRPQPRRRTAAPPARALHYKVVELSNVDEGALERTLNEWVPRGWRFDGVQFAMRESSKRPAMGFVFFTRPGSPLVELADEPARGGLDDALEHLDRPSRNAIVRPLTTHVDDAWARLRSFADDEGES